MPDAVQVRKQREPLVQPGQVQPHPRDMAVVFSADATLAHVQAALAPHGQWLPLDGPGEATMRELALHDSTGPLRLGYGGLRDFLTGVQSLDGRGDLVTCGGVMVKNVAGYDLVKFIVGSHGCFGTPITLTTRTYRRPEAALTVTFDMEPSAADVRNWLISPAAPHWMLWTARGLALGWLGRDREMAALLPTVEETGASPTVQSLTQDVELRRSLLDCGAEGLRISAAPLRVCRLAKEVANGRFAVDPVHGVLWMPVPERMEAVLRTVKSMGGHCTWRGRDGVRLFNVPPATMQVLRALKKEFDPTGQFAPLPFDS